MYWCVDFTKTKEREKDTQNLHKNTLSLSRNFPANALEKTYQALTNWTFSDKEKEKISKWVLVNLANFTK